MDELEARIRCLELAAVLSPTDRQPKIIVEIATTLYNFATAVPEPAMEPATTDKLKRVKKAAVPDIMS